MVSLLGVMKRPHVKSLLENFSCTGGHNYDEIVDILCKAGAHWMIESMCCPKVEQPDLHVDKTKSCPTFIPLKSTHGFGGKKYERCTCCGVHKKIYILSALSNLPESEELVEVMVWRDSPRQGFTNRKQNSQRELHADEMPIKELVQRFMIELNICIPHYQEICWIHHL